MNRFNLLLRIIIFLAFSTSTVAEAQLLKDTASVNLVKKDIDCIYNMQFREAHEYYNRIVSIIPDHPVVYLLRGMITYWGNYPLLHSSPAKTSFEADMKECIRIAENNKSADNEAEYLLSNLCGRGFLLMYYADNDLVMEVIPLTTGTYKFLMRSFDFTSSCTDLYYFTGMYNYYRDAYPKAYPVYKPLALLFPSGDRQKGLYQLNTAAIGSVLLRAESAFLLIYIYTNFENDYVNAYKYSRSLHELYPENPQFLASYLKNLLLLRKYDDAEKIIGNLPVMKENKYLQAQLNIFRGLINEKKYSDILLAEQYYSKGISDIAQFNGYGNEYAAYGYFGLCRISKAKGEEHAADIYRKEALKLADFKKIDFD